MKRDQLQSEPHPTRSHSLAWATSIDLDRAKDRRRMGFAVGVALVLHSGLLLVHFKPELVAVPQPIEAVIVPMRSVRVQPEKRLKPSTRSEPSSARATVPVPEHLAPEPLLALAPEVLPVSIELQGSPIEMIIPTSPPPPPESSIRFMFHMDRPVRLSGWDPVYTEAARKAREQGIVVLDAVIDRTGRVTEIEVLRSLRFGLTEAAVRAVVPGVSSRHV